MVPGENSAPKDSKETAQAVTAKLVAFIRDIGLEVQCKTIEGTTVLPGITVEDGTLLYDPAKMIFPGDLLHEAGHLAVKAPEDRRQASRDLGGDPAEEMMSIAWSYAAILHLGLPPEIVFHPSGYRGGAQSLLDNFAAGRYLAVPMLQWLGMAYDDKRAQEVGVAPYPRMVHWLRQS